MKKIIFIVLLLKSLCGLCQPIAVDSTTYTIPQLVTDVLINSPCAQISNISWNNCDEGIGHFTNTNSNFPMSSGVVMTTGKLSLASIGYQFSSVNCGFDNDTSSSLFTYIQSLGIDPGLTSFQDVKILEFDFLPFTNAMSFDFLFASNVYGAYQCEYSDAFAFFLTNTTTNVTTNLALVPGTTDPISVLTIRNSTTLNAPINTPDGSPCLSVNEQFFGIDNQTIINPAVNFFGQTVKMTAQSTVTPGNLYHIEIIIGDRNAWGRDSAVFIEAGSFNTGTAEISYPWGLGTETADMTTANGILMCPGECKTLNSGLPNTGYTFEWTKDGVILPNETSSTITVCQAGTYCVSANLTTAGANPCVQTDCLIVDYLPGFNVNPAPLDYIECDDLLDNTFTYNLNNHIPEILGAGLDPSQYDVFFYLTAQDAQDNTNQIPATYTTTQNPLTVYVRIESFAYSCPVFSSFDANAVGCTFSVTQPSDLVVCDDASNDGVAFFDLTQQESTILTGLTASNYTVSYHTSSMGAGIGIDLATPFSAFENTTNPQTIYVRVEETSSGAVGTTSFQLIVLEQPYITSISGVSAVCEGQNTAFDFVGSPNATVNFDVNGNNGSITLDASGMGNYTVVAPTVNQTISLSSISLANCSETLTDSYTITVNSIPVVDQPDDVTECDSYILPMLSAGNYYTQSGGTGILYNSGEEITTTTTLYIYAESGTTPNCTNESSFTVTIHQTPTVDVLDDVSVCDSYILPTLSVGDYYTQSGGTGTMLAAGEEIIATTTLYIYAESGTTPNCFNESSFTITIDSNLWADIIANNSAICENQEAIFYIEATPETTLNYTLDNGVTIEQLSISSSGNYTLVVPEVQNDITLELLSITENTTLCSTVVTINSTVLVIASETTATLEVTEIEDGTLEVTVIPEGDDTWLYQLDNGEFQSGNVFTNVENGTHTITVTDANGCIFLSTKLMVFHYPKFFTPNGDGLNDTWTIDGLDGDKRIYIFDRYGKLIKEISQLNNFEGWDGTFNGVQLPSTDYWFSLQYEEDGVAKEFKAHFSLKR